MLIEDADSLGKAFLLVCFGRLKPTEAPLQRVTREHSAWNFGLLHIQGSFKLALSGFLLTLRRKRPGYLAGGHRMA